MANLTELEVARVNALLAHPELVKGGSYTRKPFRNRGGLGVLLGVAVSAALAVFANHVPNAGEPVLAFGTVACVLVAFFWEIEASDRRRRFESLPRIERDTFVLYPKGRAYVTLQIVRRNWFATRVIATVSHEDGPWWDALRRELPIMEAERESHFESKTPTGNGALGGALSGIEN